MRREGGGGEGKQLSINIIRDSFGTDSADQTLRHIREDNIKRVLEKQVVELHKLDWTRLLEGPVLCLL